MESERRTSTFLKNENRFEFEFQFQKTHKHSLVSIIEYFSFCLPLAVAVEKPHVFMTMGYLSHLTMAIKCTAIANEMHFI